MQPLATDELSALGTIGFFLPAAVLLGLVVGAVVRDRRRRARQENPGARGPESERITPPPAD